MYCRKCGEENPENAVFCKNCGSKLKEEEVKKATVIETPIRQEQTNQNTYTQQSTASSKKKDDDWLCCCGCLLAIFIIFAIASLL